MAQFIDLGKQNKWHRLLASRWEALILNTSFSKETWWMLALPRPLSSLFPSCSCVPHPLLSHHHGLPPHTQLQLPLLIPAWHWPPGWAGAREGSWRVNPHSQLSRLLSIHLPTSSPEPQPTAPLITCPGQRPSVNTI